ncbi:hypothetical protein BJX63DRAFT_297178 [Aspergillus granulosus]|uniref:BTB domain-containing protein n=1 Tax=Aspergillus granulosus TaxID=176169 RepID=A0ABR4H667_9EURO
MPDVHEDVSHTLVHFLYSGEYETINSPLDESTSDVTREYKRSVLAYQASRTYSLSGLEVLAKQKIEILSEEVSLLDILQTTRNVFSKLPGNKTWLLDYIERHLQESVMHGQPDIVLNIVYNTIGRNHGFDNAVMKIMLKMLSARLKSWESACKDGKYKMPMITVVS